MSYDLIAVGAATTLSCIPLSIFAFARGQPIWGGVLLTCAIYGPVAIAAGIAGW